MVAVSWQSGDADIKENGKQSATESAQSVRKHSTSYYSSKHRSFVRLGLAYQSITTSESHSASLSVPSDDDLEQVIWVALDIPTYQTPRVSYLFAHCTPSIFSERRGKRNLWHLKSGNGKDVFRCDTKAVVTGILRALYCVIQCDHGNLSLECRAVIDMLLFQCTTSTDRGKSLPILSRIRYMTYR